MNKIKKMFCWMYYAWLSKVVDSKSDPLVIVLDWLFGSSCKYCMTTRALLFGVGVGLGGLIGVVLMITAVLLTLGEKLWLCEIKE
jgi:hypothetical protein